MVALIQAGKPVIKKFWKDRFPLAYAFYCPGCEMDHWVTIKCKNFMEAEWSYSGTLDKPTFNPSIVTTYGIDDKEKCHIYVRNGQIQFLGDCTHKLAGQTVSMEPYEGT